MPESLASPIGISVSPSPLSTSSHDEREKRTLRTVPLFLELVTSWTSSFLFRAVPCKHTASLLDGLPFSRFAWDKGCNRTMAETDQPTKRERRILRARCSQAPRWCESRHGGGRLPNMVVSGVDLAKTPKIGTIHRPSSGPRYPFSFCGRFTFTSRCLYLSRSRAQQHPHGRSHARQSRRSRPPLEFGLLGLR